MKIPNYIMVGVVVVLSALTTGLFISCEKDNGSSSVVIDSVCLHNNETTTTVITKARVGTMVRLEGKGFSAATAVYCNGVEVQVNPTYVIDNSIIFTIPSDCPVGAEVDASVRNKIRVVTKNGDFSFDFLIQGPAPSISGVSHTLPREGEPIEIYGSNLADMDTLIFPGNIVLKADQFVINEEKTMISCVVPVGATATPGAIYVKGNNGEAYSHSFMNRTECIFLKKFWGDAIVAPNTKVTYSGGMTGISGDQTAIIPATGTGPKSPATYRIFPTAAANIAVSESSAAGGFYFNPDVAAISVVGTSGGAVTESNACSGLALQFDYYMPVPWSSGFIRIDLQNGVTNWRVQYAPWAGASPVIFGGWRTATIPLSAFPALSGESLGFMKTQCTGKQSAFSFINGTYAGNGNSYTPSAITGFQFAFSNLRIVPYTKSQANND